MLKAILHLLQNNKKAMQSLFGFALLFVFVLTQMPSIEIDQKTDGLDKIFHFLSFFGLAILGLFAFTNKKPITIFSLFLYGIFIEILQKSLPFNRSFEVKDILTDVLGIFIGTVVFIYMHNKIKSL